MASFIPASDWGLFAFRMEAEPCEVRDARPADGTRPTARSWTGCARSSPTADRCGPREIEHDAEGGRPRAVVGLGRRQARARVPVDVRRGGDRGSPGVRATVRPRRARDPRDRDGRPSPRQDAIRELVRRARDRVRRGDGIRSRRLLAHRGSRRGHGRDRRPAGRRRARPVTVAGWTTAGRPSKAWLHRDAALPRRVDAAALLTPFDPVVWFRDRAERLFDFEYRIEIYTPAPKRRFGYYSLPVLVGDDIVGRVDLKADRAASTLLVQSAWWEPGRPADAAPRIADELRAAARWQGLEAHLGLALGRRRRRSRRRACRRRAPRRRRRRADRARRGRALGLACRVRRAA